MTSYHTCKCVAMISHCGVGVKDLHDITQCLVSVSHQDIINIGLALGLHYPSLKSMQLLPHDMVLAWLQENDDVAEKTGEPTAQALIQALLETKLTGIADIVKSKFSVQ